VSAAHQHGKKTLLALQDGGFSGDTSPEFRDRFVQNLLQVIDEDHYDGIDFDWEEKVDVCALVATAALLKRQRPDLLLTFPLP